MNRKNKLFLTAFFVVAVLYAMAQVFACMSVAYAGEPSGISEELRALQPALSTTVSERLSAAFVLAADEYDHDPLLLASMAMRESSLSREVAECRRLGALGERGLMQIHGVAARMAPCSDQCDAICSIRSGAFWLAEVRSACPGSTWRWVASYGWSRCTTEEEARGDTAARRARDLYLSIGGERWEP